MTKQQHGSKRGFTLIEVLMATIMMAMIMAIVATSFVQVVRAQQTADRHQKALHHGEFVMELLAEAMRSTAFLGNATEKFGFRLEDDEQKYPADIFSFVTSSSAFIHPGSPLKHGLHRLQVSIHEDEECLAVLAYPHLIDDSEENEDWEPDDAWVVSRQVKGIDCRPYSIAEESFEDEWESENTVPQFVEITLFIEIEPKEKGDKPEVFELLRVVELPVGYFAREQTRLGGNDAEAARQDQEDIEASRQQQPQQGLSPVQSGANTSRGGANTTQGTGR